MSQEYEIAAAEESVQNVIADYAALEAGTFPNHRNNTVKHSSEGNSKSSGPGGSRGGGRGSDRGGDDRVKPRGEPSGAWSDPAMHQLFPAF